MVKNSNKWYNSKTIWALVAAEAALLAGFLSGSTAPWLVLVGSMLNALAVYGRAVASGPVK